LNKQIETVVLDSQGLSAWIAQDRKILAMLQTFYTVGVNHSQANMPRLHWTLARVKVEPVTKDTAKASAELLKAAGLHSHKYAIDATVAEAALRQPGPVAMLTSDIDDMTRLCGGHVQLIGI
jgi:hypothetical protein